ncbi:recombinase family protein [Thalassotalea euphylliae]|uniref:recombinase family protein n=1 Tax=Thalassotalea euphylliae TaxID=1655234 RepID=UPI00363F303B
MTTAYSYKRFSSAKQASGDSLRRQTEAAEKYCQDNGLTLSAETFNDLGVSAFDRSNVTGDAALAQFIEACEKGFIQAGSYLIVESLDRLSRATVEDALMQLLTLIRQHQITVVTLLDNRVYQSPVNTTDLIISITIMERAHDESATKRYRSKASWSAKRNPDIETKKIKNCPFWLRLNSATNTYELVPDKAAVVKRVFQLSVDGLGGARIAQTLNSENVKPPKAKAWGKSSIMAILSSDSVIGHFQHKEIIDGKYQPVGEVITDYFPPAIDKQLFHLSRSRIKQRKIKTVGRSSDRFTNVFNNLAKCRKCGSAMTYSKKKANQSYLTCTKKLTKQCDNKAVPYRKLERFIFQQYLRPAFFEDVNKLATPALTPVESVEVLQAELEATTATLDAVLASIGTNTNDAITNRIQQLSENITDLNQRIENHAETSAEAKAKSIHASFREAYDFTLDCFNSQRAASELYRDRVKLNRILQQTFDKFELLHIGNDVHLYTDQYDYTYFKNQWVIGLNPSIRTIEDKAKYPSLV